MLMKQGTKILIAMYLMHQNITPNFISYVADTALLSNILIYTPNVQGTTVAQWLRCCATNRKVAGMIPDGVGIFR